MNLSRLVVVVAIGTMVTAAGGCGAGDTFNRAYTRGANINSMIAMKNLAVALEAYRAEHGEYPSAESMNELRTTLGGRLGDERGIDRWGEPLVVTVTPNSYLVTSKGDDKQGGHEYGGPVEVAGHSITLKDGIFVQYNRLVESTAREYEEEISSTHQRGKSDAQQGPERFDETAGVDP